MQLNTSEGAIVVALDTRHAPATSKNFLAYVDDGRFDGTSFYRAARDKRDPQKGFVQGGIRTDARRILPPSRWRRRARPGSSISTPRSRWRGDDAVLGGRQFLHHRRADARHGRATGL
ncbi:hypothetical protein GCM10020258_00890 [Sphingomonas yabuuchiae]